MTNDLQTTRRKAYWIDYGPLWVLLGFTLIAALGYFFFALRPQNLALFPPAIASFYAISFGFFAQAHVLLTGLVLGLYLFRKAGLAWLGPFMVVYAVSLLSEYVGTGYGLPFGEYSYTALLGPQWLDRVPLLIPLSWFTMAVPSYVLARAVFPGRAQRVARIALGALLLTLWDLSLDPAMSYLTPYWLWGEAGPYYGMPLINLFGWYLTGSVLMGLFTGLGVDRWIRRLEIKWATAYYLLTLMMPFSMVLAAGIWGSVLVTLAAVGLCAWWIYHRLKANALLLNTPIDPDVKDQMKPVDPSPRPAHVAGLVADLPVDVWDYFSKNSLSFSFAAAFFSREERRRVSCVYAYCRLTDDLVDETDGLSAAVVEERLEIWLALSQTAYEHGNSGIEWLDEIMTISREAHVPFSLIMELVEGVRMDLGLVELKTVDELNTYSYHVASVVGIWMCYLFGINDAWSLERAAALGRGMQITNILRDVGEDLRRDRVYLPASLLQKHRITRQDLDAMETGAPITPAYQALIDELMELAEANYEHAWEAIPHLPRSFGRVIAIAASVYRGIHQRILRNRYNNFRYRAYTKLPQKVVLGFRGRVRRYLLRRLHQPFEVNEMGAPKHLPISHRRRPLAWLASLFLILLLGFTVAFGTSASDASADILSGQQEGVAQTTQP